MPVKRVPDLSRFLKNTTSLNVRLSLDRLEIGRPADVVVEWLARRTGQGDMPFENHISELTRRRMGGNSIPEAAARSGVPVALARSSRLLDLFAFARFDLDGMVVSVDVFNAGNELGIEDGIPGETVEIFVLDCPRDELAPRLRNLLLELVSELPVECAFGGANAFTARFAFGLRREQSGLEVGRTPGDFLWPLMFTRRVVDPATLGSAGLFHVEEIQGGHVLQIWPSISNGQHDIYRAASHALGLGCLWDLKSPKIDVAPNRLR